MGLLPTRDAPPGFQALADATPALIWVDAGAEGRTLVNRAWREFTGAGPEDDLGDGWRARVHPDDAERCGAIRTAAIAEGEPFELETACVGRTGATAGCSTAAPRSARAPTSGAVWTSTTATANGSADA